jgi:hypothetical protein
LKALTQIPRRGGEPARRDHGGDLLLYFTNPRGVDIHNEKGTTHERRGVRSPQAQHRNSIDLCTPRVDGGHDIIIIHRVTYHIFVSPVPPPPRSVLIPSRDLAIQACDKAIAKIRPPGRRRRHKCPKFHMREGSFSRQARGNFSHRVDFRSTPFGLPTPQIASLDQDLGICGVEAAMGKG